MDNTNLHLIGGLEPKMALAILSQATWEWRNRSR